jgi:hypothetical protein
MRKNYLLLIALALVDCGSSQIQQQIDAQSSDIYAREKAENESNVGKDYWVRGVVHSFCPTPSTMGVNCTPLAGAPLANIHMKVDSIERGVGVSHSIAFFHVTLDDRRTGYIMTSDLLAHGTDIDPVKAAADCKRRGDPHIGMTAKQVEATCWGKPDRVNRTQTAGVISDQYVYDNGRYVYLRNGIVTSIQATDTLR